MKNWVLSPTRINFVTSPPTASVLPGVTGTNTTAAAAFDENNQLLFSAAMGTGSGNGTTILDKNGVAVGTIPLFTSPTRQNSNGFLLVYGGWGPEMAVVPVPGVCRRFYLVYTQYEISTHALLYAEIDCSGAAPVIRRNNTLLQEPIAGNCSGLAVSRVMSDGYRYLYSVRNNVARYQIGSSGITLGTTGTTALTSSPTEADISPDKKTLAWPSTNSANVMTQSLNELDGGVTQMPVTYSLPAGAGKPYGLEFSPDSKKLYCTTYASSPLARNLYVLNLAVSPAQFTLVSSTAGLGSTQLELGADGLIYGVNTSGRLVTINPNTNAVATSPLTTVLGNSQNAFIQYTLPDQIDGENYGYFFGLPAPTLAPIRVAGFTLNATTPTNVYNCKAMPLSSATTNTAQVQLTLTSALPDGTTTSTYAYSTGWVSTLPSDLRTIDNNYLATRSGYFQVKVEARDACGKTLQQVGLLQVSALTTASASFKFNDGTGLKVAPGNSATAPALVGSYGLGIDISFSTGVYTAYRARIERLTPATQVYTLVCDATVDVSTTPSLSSIGLNGLVKRCGPTGYFADPANFDQTYRLTLYLTNACGTSAPVTGYFRNFTTDYLVAGPANGTRQPAYLLPNPVQQGHVRLYYQVVQAQAVQLCLLDATGRVCLRQTAHPQEAGEQELALDVTGLPPGVYYYHLLTDRLETGRLLKTR
ncbi:hypothetical protein FY528_21110 [Hymenobacter lutimineralis]|uniref:T9SS type A sorting domain-containing protein n=2 Tax=Hymenobacter lutimineralis TaxID=2606448 RepID=A0A5D6UQW1_9BACT|nr:hypothetical protein FY528_21110 [Hymenobacter lutimineralis]